MSPEAQRIIIAEVHGWHIKPDMIVGGYILKNKTSGDYTSFWSDLYMSNPPTLKDVIDKLPDYLNDLNAMHEAWCNKIKGIAVLEDAFTYYLLEACGIEDIGSTDDPNYCTADIAIISNATAAQRAEAFIKTLDLWNN